MATSILKARISLDTSAIKRGTKAIRSSFNNIAAAGLKLGGVAIAAGLGASVKVAADFGQEMTKVRTIMDQVSDQDFSKIKAEVLEIAQVTGKNANDAAKGLYQTISAGVTDPEKALAFLRTSAKLSAAGFIEMETSVKGLTNTLDGFGVSSDNAANVADLLFKTVKIGKTDMEGIASSVGQFAGIAKTLNEPIASTLGLFAQLTKTQGSAENATTSLKGVLTAFLKPSRALTAALKNIEREQGVTNYKSLGLAKTLDLLAKSTGGSEVKLGKLFTNVRGIQGILGLTGTNFSKTTAAIDEMENAMGALDEGLKVVESDSMFKFNEAMVQMQSTGIKIGDEMLPELVKVLDIFSKTVKDLEKSGHLETFAKNAAAGLGMLIEVAGFAIKTYTDLSEVFSKLFTKFHPLTKIMTLYGKYMESQAGTALTSMEINSAKQAREDRILLERITLATETTAVKIPGESI